MKEEMKRKIISIGIVGCLLLTGLLSVSTVGMELRVEDVDQNDATKNIESDTLWHGGRIYTYVAERYGTKGNPEYRPLGDVKIIAKNLIIPEMKAGDATDERGDSYIGGLFPGLYLVNASKEGYIDISSGAKKSRVIWVGWEKTIFVRFTLEEKGSTWDQNLVIKDDGDDMCLIYGYVYERESSPKKYLKDVKVQHVEDRMFLPDEVISETTTSDRGYYELEVPKGEIVKILYNLSGYKDEDWLINLEWDEREHDVGLWKESKNNNLKNHLVEPTIWEADLWFINIKDLWRLI